MPSWMWKDSIKRSKATKSRGTSESSHSHVPVTRIDRIKPATVCRCLGKTARRGKGMPNSQEKGKFHLLFSEKCALGTAPSLPSLDLILARPESCCPHLPHRLRLRQSKQLDLLEPGGKGEVVGWEVASLAPNLSGSSDVFPLM